LIKLDNFIFDYVSEKLKGDREVVLAAVKQNTSALQYADDKLKADKELLLIATKGGNLEVANAAMRNDKNIVLAAVKSNGYALEHASEKLKGDKEVVLAAVKKNGQALQYASDNIEKNIVTSHIKYKKLKKDMDNDADFLLWDSDEKVSITHSGNGNNTNYRVSVESNQDEETSEYEVYGEFASSINEIKSAVECFWENGGDFLQFYEFLNWEKVFMDLETNTK